MAEIVQETRTRNQIPALMGLIDISLKFHSFKKEPHDYFFEAIKFINKYLPEIIDIAVYFPNEKNNTFELFVDRINNRKLASSRLFKVEAGLPSDVYKYGFSRMIPDIANIEDPDLIDSYPVDIGSYFVFSVEPAGDYKTGVIALYSPKPFFFDEDICIVLGKLSLILGTGIGNFFSMKEAVDKSFKDELTGAYNRRFFNEQYEHELYRHRRYDSKFSLLLLDIDFFKKLNDSYGHQAGDVVLKLTSRTIQETVRKSDTLARWGGEEFIIFLPDTNKENAVFVAEKIRVAMENLVSTFGEELKFLRAPVTISIGVACYPLDGIEKQELIEYADVNLYKAKSLGRNRVVSE